MFLLKKILSSLLLPPAGPLLVALAGLWLARRRPRLGRFITTLSLLGLLALSIPWCSQALLAGLEESGHPTDAALAENQAIVILGGGIRLDAPEYGDDTVNDYGLERLRYGARLARQTALPIAITGGIVFSGKPEAAVMAEALSKDFGVTARWLESGSRDTAENAARLAPILKEAGVTRIALVTHAWHMARARRLFEQQGLTVTPAPTVLASHGANLAAFLPSAQALRGSAMALHEHLGMWMEALAAAQ